MNEQAVRKGNMEMSLYPKNLTTSRKDVIIIKSTIANQPFIGLNSALFIITKKQIPKRNTEI
jgi:hypothetical protein